MSRQVRGPPGTWRSSSAGPRSPHGGRPPPGERESGGLGSGSGSGSGVRPPPVCARAALRAAAARRVASGATPAGGEGE
eukprot:scaffold13211_cov72-Phaeocystis_antarctica.AAC.3